MYRGPFLQEEQRLAHDLTDCWVREYDLIQMLHGKLGMDLSLIHI